MKYVSQQDRANEARALEVVRKECARQQPGDNWLVHQQSDLSAYDGTLVRAGKLYALVEVKSRNGDGDYATWHISKAKIDKITAHARRLGVKFFLVFAWSGVDYVLDVTKLDLARVEVREGGRWDRGAANDVEAMYHFPAKSFWKI